MPKYVIDKNEMLQGLALSEELGGIWRDQKAVDFYRSAGIWRPGFGTAVVYSETSTPALTDLPTIGVRDGNTVYFLTKNHGVKIALGASSDTVTGIAFSGGNIGEKEGAAMYKIANGNRALFYYDGSDIGMYDTTLAFTNANFTSNFMSVTPANAAAIGDNNVHNPLYHFKKRDIMYFVDGANQNQVSQFDANTGANGTLTRNALDLPSEYSIMDFAYLDNFLAILAVTPKAINNNTLFKHWSKVFYWDTYSDSWNYETPEIKDRVLRLYNEGAGLYGVGEGDGISNYQFTLSDAQLLLNHPGVGNTIDLKTAIRGGADYANYGAVQAMLGQALILGKDGNDAHIFSIGNRLGLPRRLNKPHFVRTATGTVNCGDLVIGALNRYYASYQDTSGSLYRIVRISTLESDQTGALTDTVELDSYFGTGGKNKTLRFVEIHFDPLGATDQVSILYVKDLTTTFANLSDVIANYQITGGASGNPGTNGTRFITDKNLSVGNFRQLRLRFQADAGSPKIRKIIVGFEYASDQR